MRKIFETPEIMVTKFDIDRSIMESDNQGPGDGWNSGLEDESQPDYDNPDLDLFNY